MRRPPRVHRPPVGQTRRQDSASAYRTNYRRSPTEKMPVVANYNAMTVPASSLGPDQDHRVCLAREMSRRVRQAYISRQTLRGCLPESYEKQNGHVIKWDGGVYQDGTAWQPVWPRLLRTIVTLSATPDDFMDAQFDAELGDAPMTPLYLDGAKAVSRFHRWRARSNIWLAEQYFSELREIERIADASLVDRHYSPTDSCVFAINEVIRIGIISPIAIYHFASAEGIHLSEQMRDETMIVLAFQFTDYTSELGDSLSPQLVHRTQQLLQLVTD